MLSLAKIAVLAAQLLPLAYAQNPTYTYPVHPKQTVKTCTLPGPGEPYQTATPAEVAMNQTWVDAALAYADTHNRISVQVFRYNCLIAIGLEDPVTDYIPNNVWSCTKSVVSLLTGIAQSQGHLKLHDRIGKYLPPNPGWGNASHRAITIHDLLTETAGFTEAIIAEAGTVGTDSSIPQEALAQPIIHPPGTFFSYSQRVPDLLAFVVQQAVGMDIQDYAQKYLFDPIGIPQDKYLWLRDRSGYTYGYAWLFIPPNLLARLGLLTQNHGNWNGAQVVPRSYIHAMTRNSPHNPCYGYLFWHNNGTPCTSADIPAAQTFDRVVTPAAPKDFFAMIGALQQNNFMIPSLNMTVTWTGFFGDTEPNLAALLSASAADLYDNFFALLLQGVENKKIAHPGFFSPPDPLDLDVNPFNFLSPQVLLADVLSNPTCNLIFCNNTIPSDGGVENLQALAQLILGTLP